REYSAAGRSEDGIEMIDRVLAGPDPGGLWRGRLQARRANHLIFAGRVDEAMEQAQLAIAEGEREADQITVGAALTALLMQTDNDIDADEIIERALAALTGDDPETMDLRLLYLTNRLVLLSRVDRTTEFEAALSYTIALAESQGSKRQIIMHQVGAGHHLEHGDWDRALLHLDQVADVPTPITH